MTVEDPALWPAEYEGLRAEARAAAAGIGEMLAAGGEDRASLDSAEGLAIIRSMMKAVEVESPLGTDEEIAGVPCRVFRAPPRREGRTSTSTAVA